MPLAAAVLGAELGETTYRCPKCKRDVVVLLACASVSCSRCGRAMKQVAVRAAASPLSPSRA